jgi:hypothetical protein
VAKGWAKQESAGNQEGQILPSLPLQKGVPRFAGFGKEGLGEILKEYVWPIMDSLVSKYQATQKALSYQSK